MCHTGQYSNTRRYLINLCIVCYIESNLISFLYFFLLWPMIYAWQPACAQVVTTSGTPRVVTHEPAGGLTNEQQL